MLGALFIDFLWQKRCWNGVFLYGSEFACAEKKKDTKMVSFYAGASDEARTRYLHLGKVALYQMSYTRSDRSYYSTCAKNVK